MSRLLRYQILVLAVAVMVFGMLAGRVAAVSALLGGLCYLMPTLSAVLVLNCFQKAKIWLPASFFWGESLKIMLSIALMVLVAWRYPALQWLPFLIGFILVSHIVFFVFWKIKYYGK